MKADLVFCLLILSSLLCLGCGSTQQREATEQLLTSDAVDRSVAQLDFRALAGETVYFDTTYLKNIKGVGFVNAEYITSSLRQQLVAARCLLREKREEADYVVEARIGVLGTDRHEVTYGMPANNFLSAASSLVPNSPSLPTLPELAVAKRNEQLAAAKIAAFAYHRETGEPVWQSGLAPVRSTAKDIWVLGAGPFQRGNIYGGTRFAGTRLEFSLSESGEGSEPVPLVDYHKPAFFTPQLAKQTEEPPVETKSVENSEPKQQAEAKPEPAKVPEPPSAAEPPKTAAIPSEPAVAESPPRPNSENETPVSPLETAINLETGLRLRFHFDQPSPLPVEEEGSQLFRLDPPE